MFVQESRISEPNCSVSLLNILPNYAHTVVLCIALRVQHNAKSSKVSTKFKIRKNTHKQILKGIFSNFGIYFLDFTNQFFCQYPKGIVNYFRGLSILAPFFRQALILLYLLNYSNYVYHSSLILINVGNYESFHSTVSILKIFLSFKFQSSILLFVHVFSTYQSRFNIKLTFFNNRYLKLFPKITIYQYLKISTCVYMIIPQSRITLMNLNLNVVIFFILLIKLNRIFILLVNINLLLIAIIKLQWVSFSKTIFLFFNALLLYFKSDSPVPICF